MKDEKNRNLTNVRAWKEDAKKLNELSYELTGIQKARVRIPEVLRRINNSEDIKRLLKKDAYIKRVKGIGRTGGLDDMIKIGFVLGVIVSIFFVISLMLPITQTTFGGVTNTFKTITPSLYKSDNQTGGTPTNVTQQIDSTIDTANGVIQASGWLPYTILVVMLVMFIVLAVNVRAHPSMMIIWIGFVIFIVMLMFIFSNSYETQINLNPSYYATQDPFTNFIMLNLPTIIGVFGFIGGIFMFVVISREPEYEAPVG